MTRSSVAEGTVLILLGVWLLAQTLVGDLPARIIAWRTGGGS